MSMFEKKENYKALAAAIVRQAMEDYRDAIDQIEAHPHSRAGRQEMEDCEAFFASDYYQLLLEVIRF